MLTLSWGNISVFGVSRLLPVLFQVIFVFRVVCVSRWVEISCIPVPCKRISVVCLPQSYAVIVKRENSVGSVLAVPAKNHRAVIQFCRNRGSCASADARGLWCGSPCQHVQCASGHFRLRQYGRSADSEEGCRRA